MTVINIALSSDNNYAQHLCVTLTSILANKALDDEIKVYVLDGGISEENKSRIMDLKKHYNFEIKFILINKNIFKKCPDGKKNHITLAAYYRLLLSEFCPYESKIIYLDCDTIVKTSLKELYSVDINNSYLAAVYDSDENIHTERLNLTKYFNSGVLLFNLKKWRENNITEFLFKWIDKNSKKIVLHDQDIINAALQEEIFELDSRWNVQISKYDTSKEFVKLLPKASIIHYIGRHKPWHTDFKQYAKEEYFKYLRLTAWKSYELPYNIKLFAKLPFLILEKLLHNTFSIEKQGNIKYLLICGFKFNLITDCPFKRS